MGRKLFCLILFCLLSKTSAFAAAGSPLDPYIKITNWHNGAKLIKLSANNVWGFDNAVAFGTLDGQTIYFYNDGANPRTMTNVYFMHPDDVDVWDYNSPFFRFEKEATLSLVAFQALSLYSTAMRVGNIETFGLNPKSEPSAVGPGARIGNDACVTNVIYGFGGTRPASITAFTATNNASVSNSNSELTLFGTGLGSLTISSNYTATGTILNWRILGHFTATGAQTVTIRVKIGSTVLASAVITPPPTADDIVEISGISTIRLAAVSGIVATSGSMYLSDSSISTGIAFYKLLNAGTVAVDTANDFTFNITAQWSAANSGSWIYTQNALLRIE